MKYFFKLLNYFSFVLTFIIAEINFAAAQMTQVKTASYPLQKIVNVENIQNDYYFSVLPLEFPYPGNEKNYLEKVKQNIPPKLKFTSRESHLTLSEKPVLLYNFEGNLFHGHVPNDNHLAVSNDGKIVSVTNSIIWFFENDSQIHSPVSLDTFGALIYHPHGKYDPRVLYDPARDRFIIVFLNGFTDRTSFIYVAFSASSDPLGNWYLYTLPGNPLNDSSWTDFPMIAINNNELFITVNLLKNISGNETWKTNFKQTIIWQLDLFSGYSGDSLISRLYDNIEFEGKRLRNICPVPDYTGASGDNMFFLSNMNFSQQTDTFFLLEITGKLNQSSTKLKVTYVKADKSYGVAPSADMPFKRLLETNDARVLDAVKFPDNSIHFVGNTINFNNNKASFYHGKLTGSGNQYTIKLNIIDHPELEFGYPNIEYTGELISDEAIIMVNHSSDSTNPGISAFFYKNGDFSDPLLVKEGQTVVTVQTGKTQRWGDYTGLQRKYNEKGVVWGSGYFGKFISSTQRVNGTWIAQLKSPTFTGKDEVKICNSSAAVYPNPFENMVTLEFKNKYLEEYSFSLFDESGKLVKILRKDYVKPGTNRISFCLEPLKSGNYYLIICNNKGENIVKSIVKQ